MGVNIPKKSICHNHQAPFDFVAAAFFESYDTIVALANRNGGKTIDFAILAILFALANPDCEGANFGAIENQALRCYGYIKKFLEGDKSLFEVVDGKITLGKTVFKNKSWLQVLIATMAGVNSPHPQKLIADEVELIPWFILQEALSMPNSKNDIKATTILGSTRKFAHGPMQRLIDDNMAHLFSWCVWETMEAWPKDVMLQQQILQTFTKKFGDTELIPKDKSQFNGFFKWPDLLTRVRMLDIETFLSQWMCQRPESTGLIYARFDEILNVDRNWVLDPSLPIQIWEDLGYAKDHPDVVLFVQVDVVKQRFVIFDELYLRYKDCRMILIDVIQKLKEHGLVATELDTDPTELTKARVLTPYFAKIAGWVCDYHNVSEIAERQNTGVPIWDKVRKEENDEVNEIYKQENYIPLVRAFVDNRSLQITPNVINLREEFMTYSNKKQQDGRYSDVAEKFNDNGPSAVAFGCVRNWPSLAYMPFDADSGKIDEEPTRTIRQNDEEVEIVSPAQYIRSGLTDEIPEHF